MAADSSGVAKPLHAEEILRAAKDASTSSALRRSAQTPGANASVLSGGSRSAHACKTPQCQRAISVARYTSTSPRSRLDCCGFDCGSLCRQSPVNVIRPGGPHSEAGGGRTFSAPVDAGPGAARSAAVSAALASRAGRDVRIEESWSRFGPNRWLVERVPPLSD